MMISIYALGGQLDSQEVYFKLSDSEKKHSITSPLYTHEEACLQAIRQTILSIRAIDKSQQNNFIQEGEQGFTIHLFGKDAHPFMAESTFANELQASTFLTSLKKACLADVFPIQHYSLLLNSDATSSSDTANALFSDIETISLTSTPLAEETDTVHSFLLKDESGKTILFGPKFLTAESRDKELFTVLRSLLLPDCYKEQESDGLHYFKLTSTHGLEMGSSRKLENKEDLDQEKNKIQQLAKSWAIRCLPEYEWKTNKSSVLNLSEKKGVKPLIASAASIPAATLLATQPCLPLFNVLRPYKKDDINRFFGRETETEELYEQTFDTRLLVVYGERSAGKTSLVQCGLANRLKPGKWHDIYIRRWLNINRSLKSKLKETANNLGCKDISKETSPMDMLRTIYQDTFQPVLLVFDQMEELFTLPYSVAEQQKFFLFIQELIQDTSFPAKVIIIINDDYLAKLADYENIVPTILDHRYHLKHLPATALKTVVNGLFGQLIASGKIQVDQPELVTQKIHDNLAGDKSTVGLACTQVYLHQAHQLTCGYALNGLSIFSPDLIDKVGKPEVAIRSYVDDKIAALEKQLPTDQGAVLEEKQAQEIEELIKLQNYCGCPETEARSSWLAKWHDRGKQNNRLMWFLRLAMLGLLFSATALGVTYCSLANNEPCQLAQKADNCEARINYLCHNNPNNDCANSLVSLLNEEDCPVWQDYKAALSSNNCNDYRAYIDKYRSQGVCVDKFYEILAERNCPTGVDTVTNVILDTVYREITINDRPTGFEQTSGKKTSDQCQLIQGENTLRLGPIFMMTSDLNEGTRYDWIGALAACKRLGPNWRLPCAGEIDFILDKHYQDASSAFENLTKGDCPIFPVSDASVSGNFWTATEANDQNAWSIYFDTKNEQVRMITNTSKNTTMPCRCVYRDPSITSGIPDCFEKQVYRPGG